MTFAHFSNEVTLAPQFSSYPFFSPSLSSCFNYIYSWIENEEAPKLRSITRDEHWSFHLMNQVKQEREWDWKVGGGGSRKGNKSIAKLKVQSIYCITSQLSLRLPKDAYSDCVFLFFLRANSTDRRMWVELVIVVGIENENMPIDA